ncbi:hypothetical protein VST7929_02188 [Vibrio stylophorae]|uniref:MarR family transcriptional regulator n=1 Tax=Vibrio stylophorae TaxID=659351 RepID=A0ABM8ZVE2_9VIBR|nr:helix-turn-helix domain-containing protein [Vibrio stylophorae]CAH0534272.1 hypothetical protein VST7929_02188 [Vibrio stylophorae]
MSTILDFNKLKQLDATYPDMTLKQLLVLSYIAQKPMCTVNDIVRDLGYAQSAASRAVRIMLNTPSKDVEGLGMIAQFLSPTDARKRLLKLTELGESMFIQLS